MEGEVPWASRQDKGELAGLKEITILSGKGGTGKTTITASFAALARNSVTVDCDVDAPDLHILLHPTIIKTQEFEGPKLAEIDPEKCVECSLCQEACRFGAIADFQIDPILCEGCGTCVVICPEDAVTLKERVSGEAFISKTKYGLLSHALLSPGGANSGKLVTLARQNAKEAAEKGQCDLILIDGPPGIGCPVIASVTGVDMGVIVTEPTVSGIHDMKRVLQLLAHFNVQPLVCINKYDLNQRNTKKIEQFCSRQKIGVIGRVPFDSMVTKAMVSETPVVEYSSESGVSLEISEMWKDILSRIRRIQ
ncbi:MAG: ATP-binding protein [Candidatus Bathyarchaeota archaeon]|nr:ATP-binding protein [Candidatus Bathyarchaeota archaeon]